MESYTEKCYMILKWVKRYDMRVEMRRFEDLLGKSNIKELSDFEKMTIDQFIENYGI